MAHLLDGGVTGIVFPDIVSPEDAKRAVASVKFAPTGSRSLGGAYPQFNYQRIPQSEAVPLLNETTVVVCMVETVAGLDNVEDIAAVEGVDVVHIGTRTCSTPWASRARTTILRLSRRSTAWWPLPSPMASMPGAGATAPSMRNGSGFGAAFVS